MPIQIIKRTPVEEKRSPYDRDRELMGHAFDFAKSAQSSYQAKAKEDRAKKELKDKEEAENKFLKLKTGQDFEGATTKERQAAYENFLKKEQKTNEFNEKIERYKKYGFSDYLQGGEQSGMPGQQQNGQDSFSDQINRPGTQTAEGNMDLGGIGLKSDMSDKEFPEEAILEAEVMGDHGIAQQMKGHNDRVFEEKKNRRKVFEGDRAYHSKYSAVAEEHANAERMSLPKKEASLDYARNSIESGEVGYFSPDKLADATGVDLFRTSKGAQLTTAGKENLLSNMTRVTGRAQNMWFEQRLNSMFPKIGQSKESNLTVLEMLEGELELDKAYLNSFDKIAARDEEDYGYVRKDIQKRAYDDIKPLEKDIMQRTSYRMKEIEEQEKGLKSMKANVGKNVPKGSPLTLAMTKLYYDKFGDKAYEVAKKNGYYIPTLEEFQRYQAPHNVMTDDI